MVRDQHALIILIAQNAHNLRHVDVPLIHEGFDIAGNLALYIAEVNVTDAPGPREAADMAVDVTTGHFLQRTQA